MLEILSPGSFSAFLQVIVIDLVLAGDNAVVIGMAAAGVGPTIIPSFVAPIGMNAQISTALLTEPVLSLGFQLIMKRGREQPAVLEAFTQALREVIADHRERIYPYAEQG